MQTIAWAHLAATFIFFIIGTVIIIRFASFCKRIRESRIRLRYKVVGYWNTLVAILLAICFYLLSAGSFTIFFISQLFATAEGFLR